METEKEHKFRKLVDLWVEKRCDLFMDDIYEYSQNGLKGKEKKRVETHLAQCDKCREAYNAFLVDIREKPEKEPVLSLIERIKNKVSSVKDKLDLVERLRSLKSGLSFPFTVVPLGVTRGPEQAKNVYAVGETILMSLEAPRDGHIAVFHYDNKGNLRLVFPRIKGDTSYVKSGDEKRIVMKATDSPGKQWIKAIFFEKDVIRMDETEEDSSGLATIESFLDVIPSLKAGKWMEAEYEFEVAEE